MILQIALWVILLCVLVLNPETVLAQDYPNKVIRIVTNPAGSSVDLPTRLIGQSISGPLGQKVIIDNRRSGVIPGQIVSAAAPDGYTLLAAGTNLWNGPLFEKTPYDPIKDFVPISITNRAPNILVVHPSLPVKSVKALIELAKARPGELNYVSAGIGGLTHRAAELFKAMAEVNIVRINYTSGSTQNPDLISGQVQMTFGSAATMMPFIKSGRLRGLAVTSATPSPLLPGFPTIAASGLPGYEAVQLQGIFAPAKTADTIVHRLNHEIVRVLNMPDIQEKFFDAGIEAVGSSPDAFLTAIKSEMLLGAKLFKDIDIRSQ